MTRDQAVLATLIVYKLLLVLIGVLMQRRTRDHVDFFLGGRKLGPLVAAVSASASSSSAWTLLGVSGAAYAWGLSALWLFPACVGGFLLNWYVLARPLQNLSHQNGAVTVTEVLAGPVARPERPLIATVASLIILVSLVTYVASQFQGAGKAFNETFGISLLESVLLGAAIVLFYTLLGGFWAVSVTDTLQGLLMAISAILLPAGALIAVGGVDGLMTGLSRVPADGYLSPTRNLSPVLAVGFVLSLLGIGFGYPGQPHVVNRFMALRKGEGALKRARRIAMVWAVVVYAGMLLLGLCGRILFPDLLDSEVVFISAANQLFHPIVSGIIIAAVLSAIMSTADSQLLVAASSITYDLKFGDLAPDGGGPLSGYPLRGRGSVLLRSRLVVVLISLGAVVIALVGSQRIFSQVLFAWTAMGAAFGPLLLITVLKGPVSSGRTLAAMIAGFSLSVLAYSFPETRGGVLERVLPFIVAFAIILLHPSISLKKLINPGTKEP
ncbi:MAG: sodium/proline symporter [Acidobacteriota bacterium]